ncbi:Crp/Fnr family transcriptional regulator [Chryseobacterium culicis]|uniref:Crp/Fnr family transcriptional regulator n=1 Tax=Chryseobacterium culicis TaxID=680127 RepID=UPI0018745022|nr:Crp/Fnr family transcriptional regulator [Chryseobacterium culicis]MBE4948259.1 Crp/Fnr family transcriptional regulator [Chryseobacterium culicis]
MNTNEQPKELSFLDFAASLAELESEAKVDLASRLFNKEYGKGELILEAGNTCSRIYFVETGLVKTFFHNGNREFIMRFFSEGNMFTVLDSFVTRTPSAYSIMTLEQTNITYLNYSDLEELCNRYHTMETFYRKLLSMAAVNMMERIGGTLEEKAQVAYHTFVKEHGKLLQRISLADLASYLGITQVSLSRIRSLK